MNQIISILRKLIYYISCAERMVVDLKKPSTILKTTILSPQNFLTSQWSGGSTTQLYIFPVNATLTEKNFELRISTAKVEVKESTFTVLPGIHRKLMILEGEISLSHEDQNSIQLQPFDSVAFSGDWKTTAIGTCTDFNVMTNGQLQTDLYYLSMEAISNYKFAPKNTCTNLFLYATSGSIHLELLNIKYTLETGNLLIIENLNLSEISITSAEEFGIVVLEIF